MSTRLDLRDRERVGVQESGWADDLTGSRCKQERVVEGYSTARRSSYKANTGCVSSRLARDRVALRNRLTCRNNQQEEQRVHEKMARRQMRRSRVLASAVYANALHDGCAERDAVAG